MQTLTVEFPSDGNPFCYKKQEPLSLYSQNLLLEDGKKREGYVVKAVDELNPAAGAAFTAFTRSK